MKMTVALRGRIPDEYARVNRFVANAELRVERQETLVRRLHHQGRDTTRAEALLEVLRESLDALRRYQTYVANNLARHASIPDQDAG
jgi:hypothetical protein